MNEPEDMSKCDSVSIVSCSTRISDVTQERDIPDLNSRKLQNGKTTFRSFDGNKLTKPWNTDGSDMSPIVPIQSATFTQKSSPEEDSVSEMSEVLIPVISNQSSVTVNKAMFEIQESQQIEESQSLLPQVPTEFHNLNMLREPTRYSKENNRQNDGWMTKKTDNIKARGGNRKIDFRENVSFVHGTSLRNDISLSQTTFLSSQKDVNSFSQQIDSTSLNEGFIFSQTMEFASEENVLTFSQVDNALNIEGEVVSSKRAVTLIEQKDPADRIISRLDRLVSSLDKVSTRQKMVIEATILQCITSLQDSLNNKLKKQQSTTDNAGIFKRLLQTTQTGLLKLTEKQRLEKLQMSQVGSQSMQHLNTQKLNQSALSDFGKRQKRVFSLLKRQKYLVDLFKTRKRSEIATDPNVRFKTDQKHELSRQSETKQVSKSGSTQPNNTNLKRNHISKTCKKWSTERESKTKIIGDSQAESKNGRAKDNDIVKTSEELSKQVSYMRRGCKDLKLPEDNVGEGLKKKDFEEEEALGKELKNVKTAGKADEVSCTVTDVTNKGGTDLEDAEDCNLTQNLTTVPDTQDFITQDSVVGNNSDKGDVEDITTNISDKEISECLHDSDNELMESGENFKMNDTARKDQIKVPSSSDTGALLSKIPLKRDIGPVAHPGDNIKKSKLIDTEATKVQENVTGKPNSELKTSEMLWLNMVRDDINKKADSVLVSKENILEGQGMVTSRRQEEKQTDRGNEKPTFQFIKPSGVVKNANLYEAENRSVKLNEHKEAGNVPQGNAPVEKSNQTKEQTDESTRKEVVNSDKNTVTVVGLSSPPNLTLPGETWHNISPTATSMSSDVFMVKMKDIQKRIRRRVELSQNINVDNLSVVEVENKNDSEIKEWKVKKVEVFDKQVGSSIQENDTVSAKIGNAILEKDTVSEAINAVIQQTRDMSKENNICRQRFENNLQVIHGNHVASHESFIPRSSALGSEVFTTREMKADTNTKQLQGGLPTLKELVQSGQLTPGKLVLSCFAKGRTHRASLTPVGKIRTQEGVVFVTASQWVSTLTEPVSVKKKKAYEMVLYKGRSLLSICLNYHCNALPNERPTNPAPVSTITVDISKSFTEQGTQVKDTDILELLPQKTECEIRLNSLLSNCVVRLLTEQDFVSCDDLPDNFWKEDFSKVRLPKDIWDTVDSW